MDHFVWLSLIHSVGSSVSVQLTEFTIDKNATAGVAYHMIKYNYEAL